MNPLRIVIIEDEPATSRNLYFTLQQTEPHIVLAATLDSVTQSVAWLIAHPHAYDLLFVDIHLSDGLSFDIFRHVEVSVPVIFVTAYDNYALQAFKTNGIDYILKPFDRHELQRALKKFRQLRIPAAQDSLPSQLSTLADRLQAAYKNYRQSFLVHFRDRLIPLAASDIAWFYTLHEVSHARCFDGRDFTVEFTLEHLQEQLDPRSFFRVNRQFIVQRRAITEVTFYFNGRLLLKVDPQPQESIVISKARVPEFKTWMNS